CVEAIRLKDIFEGDVFKSMETLESCVTVCREWVSLYERLTAEGADVPSVLQMKTEIPEGDEEGAEAEDVEPVSLSPPPPPLF
ncbi:hypothetical protein KIPB_014788, partial [Kipferlia bialata]